LPLKSSCARRSESASLNGPTEAYFDQDRKIEELLDYMRIIRQYSIPRPENASDGEPSIGLSGHLVQRLLLGALSAFVLGGLYVILNPTGDVWAVVLPAFFRPILAVEVFSGRLGK